MDFLQSSEDFSQLFVVPAKRFASFLSDINRFVTYLATHSNRIFDLMGRTGSGVRTANGESLRGLIPTKVESVHMRRVLGATEGDRAGVLSTVAGERQTVHGRRRTATPAGRSSLSTALSAATGPPAGPALYAPRRPRSDDGQSQSRSAKSSLSFSRVAPPLNKTGHLSHHCLPPNLKLHVIQSWLCAGWLVGWDYTVL